MQRQRFKKVVFFAAGCIAMAVSILMDIYPKDNNFWGAGAVLQVSAGNRTLTLTQAQNLAFANSIKYGRVQNKIILKQIKYQEAVKSIQLKQKNMSTFRWSPLLNFKFPTRPDLAEAYEWQYKPLQIQTEINVLKHELADIKYAITEDISILYVNAYIQQEKIEFIKNRIESREKTLKSMEIKVKTGEAKQEDADALRKSIHNLESDYALVIRNFEKTKSNMNKILKMDISSGYTFANPMISADIKREALKDLVSYTLEQDHSYFETKLTTAAAKSSLSLNYELMSNHYGGDIRLISSYVQQALNGQTIDSNAFKTKYNIFLNKIDSYWQGKKRIFLFIKIPREWLRGALDGVRFIEDEPYALYTSALDYQDARLDQEAAMESLTSMVTEGFENLITLKNAWLSMQGTVDELKQELEKSTLKNKKGELAFEDLKADQEEYEEYSFEALGALAAYSEQLYAYNRLTCGGITKYLKGEGLSLEAAEGGESFLVEEGMEGASYYIQSKVEDEIFILGVIIPGEFEPEISEFELWIDGTQIGARTGIDKTIRHFTLDLDQVENVIIRLYDGEKAVADCKIDPEVMSGPLKINGISTRQAETGSGKKTVASFQYKVLKERGLMEMTIQPETTEPIFHYMVTDLAGKAVYQEEPLKITETFRYLSFITGDFSNMKINLYDREKNLLYTGDFDGSTLKITVEE